MAKNVGKTHMEENLGRWLSKNQGKILIGLGLVILGLMIWSSEDYFLEYGGVVVSMDEEYHHYIYHKRTRKKIKVYCVILRYDGDDQDTKVCNQDPSVFKYLKPRHRFIKKRFRRYMRSVGGEVDIPWLEPKGSAETKGEGSAETKGEADGGQPSGPEPGTKDSKPAVAPANPSGPSGSATGADPSSAPTPAQPTPPGPATTQGAR